MSNPTHMETDDTAMSPAGEPLAPQERAPVLIPIHCNDDDVPEWAMIEVNGELLLPLEESPDHESNSNELTVCFDGGTIELGALSFRDKKTPILVVGTHELQGVIEELSEPFVCLQAEDTTTGTSYAITGVVRRKLLFNRYPKTLLR